MMNRMAWWGRTRTVAIAVVLAVVQFGLVQHAYATDVDHVDTACAYCVAGDHHSPEPSNSGRAIPFPALPCAAAATLPEAAAEPSRAAHLVRGPPSIS